MPNSQSSHEENIAVNTEMRLFMTRQDEINSSLLKSVKAIESAITKSDSMQVELNSVSSKVDKVEAKIESMSLRQNESEKQLEVNKTIIKQQEDMKAMFVRAFIGLAAAFVVALGTAVFMDNGDKEFKSAVIELSKKNK